jgi:putative tryptophan/tyrosine transport system substrate-binding protein
MKKACAILTVICLLLAGLCPALAEEKTYTIGICQLAPHPALDAATQGFRDYLTEKLGDRVTFIEQNASGEIPTCIQIMNTLISDNVDLIMANATGALQSAQSATGDIPILGTAVTDYGVALDLPCTDGKTGTNISGTSDLAPLDQQAAMIKELFPDAKEVGLLYCSAEANSAYQIAVITEELTKLGYHCTEYAFSDSSDVTSMTTNACLNSDVIYVPTDNTVATCADAICNVSVMENVPVIAGEEGACAGCGVATLSISYYELGRITGEMAYEVLVEGADISQMAIRYAPTTAKKYNAELCEIFGLTMPSDYEAIE